MNAADKGGSEAIITSASWNLLPAPLLLPRRRHGGGGGGGGRVRRSWEGDLRVAVAPVQVRHGVAGARGGQPGQPPRLVLLRLLVLVVAVDG